MTVHPRDDLAAYVLGALEPSERELVAGHLDVCADCRTEATAYEQSLWAIAESASLPTPAGLGQRIAARARGPVAIGRRDVGWWLRGLAGAARRPVPALVPITLAIALALSLVALQSVLRDAEAYRSAVAGVADGRVIALTETGEAAAARGSLVVPKVGQPYLVLILPKPPADRTWEAWILRGDEPIAAGVSGDRSGVVTIVLTAPLRDGDGVAVTLERAGGVARPTTPPILVGRVS